MINCIKNRALVFSIFLILGSYGSHAEKDFKVKVKGKLADRSPACNLCQQVDQALDEYLAETDPQKKGELASRVLERLAAFTSSAIAPDVIAGELVYAIALVSSDIRFSSQVPQQLIRYVRSSRRGSIDSYFSRRLSQSNRADRPVIERERTIFFNVIELGESVDRGDYSR